jgi:endonuclease YncB( thermonuclease family)
VYLKKAKPLNGPLRERPARHRDYPFFRPDPRPRPKRPIQLNLNLRSRGSAKIAALAAIVAFAVAWGVGSIPWPVTATHRYIAAAPNCDFSACAQTLTGTATIIDADTIVIRSERIRLQGVDAPETDQICLNSRGAPWNCGIDARDRLLRHIGSRETSCVTNGKDAFGRWLATCSTNEVDLSAWLVREGFGLAFIRYSNAYVAEESNARSAQKGMWAGAFIAPWDWRARTARPLRQSDQLAVRRSSSAVATSREGHRSLRSDREGQRRRWGPVQWECSAAHCRDLPLQAH